MLQNEVYSLSLWTAPIGPFMILSWQLDGAGWLISIISFMFLILAARWLSLHAVFLPVFCPHSALIWQLKLAPKTSTKDIAIRNTDGRTRTDTVGCPLSREVLF